MGIWSKFDKQSEECYTMMVSGKTSVEVWLRGYELFRNGLENWKRPESKRLTLELLEDATDWEHDFSGWLEDFLDELGMNQRYQELLEVVEYLEKTFDWSDGDYYGLKFNKAECLWSTGREKEAYTFCEKWFAKESDNPSARAALIYACVHAKKYDEAKTYADEVLSAEPTCTDENYVVYYAAEKLYRGIGETEKAEELLGKMESYEKLVERELEEAWAEAWDEEELPFD